MIYVHVPFCASKCHYCDFYSVASTALRAEVLAAMGREIVARRDFFGGSNGALGVGALYAPRTIYFGGGTPSVLNFDELSGLVAALRANFDLSKVEEWTVEANPEHLTPQYLTSLRSLGVNRLSIGIQSFVDDHLVQMNRRHTADEACRAVENARRTGFENISIDLIYGLPFMSDEQWAANVARAVALELEHISAYHLSIEERTVFHKRGMQPIDEQRSKWQYEFLCGELRRAGFEHYEISNFALPTRHSRHNSGYWTGAAYLGIGASAHSFDGATRRSWNVANNTKYIADTKGESETLTPQDIHNEYLMTRLRTARGVDLAEYSTLFGCELSVSAPFVVTQTHAHIAESDFLIADALIAPLFR